MKDYLFAIWLSLRCGIAGRAFLPLIEEYGTPYAVFEADYQTLISSGVSKNLAEKLSDKNLDRSYSIMSFCELNDIVITYYGDTNYPRALKSLADPPIVLYMKGQIPNYNQNLCVGIVGKRNMSEYGMNSAYRISYELASAGVIIVSGMAIGIDGTSAGAAIAAGGETIAVLGSGIDVIYPRQHKKLYENILKHGCVMTEYPPQTPPSAYNFPTRNRIISGISEATLIVEADDSSGAMITAKSALVQGREVFAVPGNIGQSGSSATNQLIHDGAGMVLSAKDITDRFEVYFNGFIDVSAMAAAAKRSDPDKFKLVELGVASGSNVFDVNSSYMEMRGPAGAAAAPDPVISGDPKSDGKRIIKSEKHTDDSGQKLAALSEKQRKIFEEMPMDRAVSADELTRFGYSIGEIMAALTMLEIKGLVQSLPGGLFARL